MVMSLRPVVINIYGNIILNIGLQRIKGWDVTSDIIIHEKWIWLIYKKWIRQMTF